MKLQYQLATEPAGGWVEIDHTAWMTIPTSQFILKLCCMGITFHGDHLAVEEVDGKVRIHCWSDDPLQNYQGLYKAHCRDISATTTVDGVLVVNAPITKFDDEDFSTYVVPNASITRHGVQISNALYEDHAVFDSEPYTFWDGEAV